MTAERFGMDGDLGLVRFCPRCDEWWPYDAEFWYRAHASVHCKACHLERQRTYRERRGAAA